MLKLNQELLESILREIKTSNKVTEKDIASKYYYSERTIRRYFKILKDNGKIEIRGNGKNRVWKIL